ncbi:MAG TPA: helix-turn-helix domain-containing protein [Magnetospirillum sp.]|jgi:transcriptional regulator with XRE-family HTH domain|nr:helix-turn-helix domain-containing protein [Magnetospirillum sp.]
MISTRQLRAARALLGWSQQTLADKAILSINAVKRLETGQGDPRMSTVLAVKAALETGGVEFLPPVGDKGEGVRLSSSSAQHWQGDLVGSRVPFGPVRPNSARDPS